MSSATPTVIRIEVPPKKNPAPCLVDQDHRECGDCGQVQSTRECQSGKDAVQVFGRGQARTDARDEPAVLLQVVRLLTRVERDRRVEVGEHDDEEALADDVGGAVRAEEVCDVLGPGLLIS